MSGGRGPAAVSLLALWKWLKQVSADRDLSPAALRVALALADKVNPERGYAWPRQSVLEEVTGLKERGIREIVAQLVARGHLSVKVSRGPGASNEYRLLLKDAEDGDAFGLIDYEENRHGGAGIQGKRTTKNRHGGAGIPASEAGENRHGGAGENRHGDDRNTGMAVPPNKPSNKPIRTSAASPLPARGGGAGHADDEKLDPTGGVTMETAEAVLRDALAERPAVDACNRGDALKRIRRRLAADRDFGAIRSLIGTGAYLVGDLRRGVREAIERRKIEPEAWADFAPFVQRTAMARLSAKSRGSAAVSDGPPSRTVYIRGIGDVPEKNVQAAVDRWSRGGPWHLPFGPEPDHPDCWLPEHFRRPTRDTAERRRSSPLEHSL